MKKWWELVKVYETKQDLYNDCTTKEKKEVIAMPIYSEEDGEFIGYKKEYI